MAATQLIEVYLKQSKIKIQLGSGQTSNEEALRYFDLCGYQVVAGKLQLGMVCILSKFTLSTFWFYYF